MKCYDLNAVRLPPETGVWANLPQSLWRLICTISSVKILINRFCCFSFLCFLVCCSWLAVLLLSLFA